MLGGGWNGSLAQAAVDVAMACLAPGFPRLGGWLRIGFDRP